jgi:hypothetical protein
MHPLWSPSHWRNICEGCPYLRSSQKKPVRTDGNFLTTDRSKCGRCRHAFCQNNARTNKRTNERTNKQTNKPQKSIESTDFALFRQTPQTPKFSCVLPADHLTSFQTQPAGEPEAHTPSSPRPQTPHLPPSFASWHLPPPLSCFGGSRGVPG